MKNKSDSEEVVKGDPEPELFHERISGIESDSNVSSGILNLINWEDDQSDPNCSVALEIVQKQKLVREKEMSGDDVRVSLSMETDSRGFDCTSSQLSNEYKTYDELFALMREVGPLYSFQCD